MFGPSWADAPVMRRVNVAHVEASPIAAQSPGTECRQAALVRQLRKRIGLIHELRELTPTEELANRRHHWPRRADQTFRRDRLRVLDRHPFANAALEPLKARPDMHLDQLTDGTDAAVAQMVDVVRLAQSIAKSDHLPDDLDQIFSRQDSAVGACPVTLLAVQAFIQLIPTNARQVISPVIEEQVLQHRRRVVPRRRITRSQPSIELD